MYNWLAARQTEGHDRRKASVIVLAGMFYLPPLLLCRPRLQPLLLLGRQRHCCIRGGGAGAKQQT